MSGIVRTPLFTGLAGLIPFIWGTLTYLYSNLNDWGRPVLGRRFVRPCVQPFYGSAVLSFMSGVLWGFVTRTSGSMAAPCFKLSVLPALRAFVETGDGPVSAGTNLIYGFAGKLVPGTMFSYRRLTPDWWMRLRLITVRSCIGLSCCGSKSVSDERTINAYTGRVADYLKVASPPEQLEARQAFADSVGAGGYVLDLGSGPGSDSTFLMQQGLKVRALDATPAFVEHARNNGVDAHQGTFDDLTETAEFDGIYASFSLLHAPRAEFPRHLSAVHTALKPGGQLFLGMKLGTGEHRDDLGRYYSYYTQDEIEDALTSAGFTIDRSVQGMAKGLVGSYDKFILVFAHA